MYIPVDDEKLDDDRLAQLLSNRSKNLLSGGDSDLDIANNDDTSNIDQEDQTNFAKD